MPLSLLLEVPAKFAVRILTVCFAVTCSSRMMLHEQAASLTMLQQQQRLFSPMAEMPGERLSPFSAGSVRCTLRGEM